MPSSNYIAPQVCVWVSFPGKYAPTVSMRVIAQADQHELQRFLVSLQDVIKIYRSVIKALIILLQDEILLLSTYHFHHSQGFRRCNSNLQYCRIEESICRIEDWCQHTSPFFPQNFRIVSCLLWLSKVTQNTPKYYFIFVNVPSVRTPDSRLQTHSTSVYDSHWISMRYPNRK